ncbi:hypothetical protein JYT16_02525 [Gemmatimonas aurantiaca]|nr:hypothetical protein [Gemmatimonas aurantiaca]
MKFTGSTKFFAFALLVTTATAYLSSCKDDIFLPDPRGLLGEYSGLLIVQDFTAVTPTNDTDHVIFSFLGGADSVYQHHFNDIWKDSGDVPNICDVDRGLWTIVDSKISFEVKAKGVGEVCSDQLIPEGPRFGFRPLTVDNVGDSLIIVQTIKDSDNNDARVSTFLLVLVEAF